MLYTYINTINQKHFKTFMAAGLLATAQLSSFAAKSPNVKIPKDTTGLSKVKPKGPKPTWAPDIKPQMQIVIEKLQSYGGTPLN